MHTIYDSDIYEKLMDAETGLYRESPSYVFGLLQDEINFGHIVQAEVWIRAYGLKALIPIEYL